MNTFSPQSAGLWDLDTLAKPPAHEETELYAVEGFTSLFYEGLTFKGSLTKVYAYYGQPAGAPPTGGWPAVVCVHGGGGTAFVEWVKIWNEYGYAAIAMDYEGHLPDLEKASEARPEFEGAGPAKPGLFEDVLLPIEEQWFPQAVAQIILAHSLLRSFPEVNADKTGIHGISWGAMLTGVVCGLDQHFKFAVPVYGCGFLHESDGFMKQGFEVEPVSCQRKIDYCDPSSYLSNIRIPTFWLNGTNDRYFPIDVWSRSVQATGGPSMQRAEIRMGHSHTHGWEPLEIYAFADWAVKGAVGFPKLGKPILEGKQIHVNYDTPIGIKEVELCFTTDEGPHVDRHWQSIPASLTPTLIKARLPSGVSGCFLWITDVRGYRVSSSYQPILAETVKTSL